MNKKKAAANKKRLEKERERIIKELALEGYCTSCSNHITFEHGGICCDNCGSLFCCSTKCIPEKYLKEKVGYSQTTNSCHICDKNMGSR